MNRRLKRRTREKEKDDKRKNIGVIYIE